MKWFVSKFNYYASTMMENFSCATAPAVTLIYGQSGLGKTEMLRRAYERIKCQNVQVIMINALDFARLFAESLQNNCLSAFRQKFRSLQLLLFDDLQLLDGKSRTVEEFLYTYENLLEQGGKIVVTLQAEFLQLDFLGEKLASRLLSGLVLPLSLPNEEELTDFLKQYLRTNYLVMAQEVIIRIAERTRNIAEAKQMVKDFISFAELSQEALTAECFTKFWEEHTKKTERKITLENILCATSLVTGIPSDQILGTKRSAEIVEARQLCMFAMRTLGNFSFPQIGKYFRKEHGATIYACQKMENKLKVDPQLRSKLEKLIEYFK